MNKTVTAAAYISICFLAVCFATSCSSDMPVGPEPKPPGNGDGNDNDGKPPTRFEDIGPVPSDGVLETVTWNIECYGLDSFCADGEINQQTKNILTVLDSLNADLYAFQELGNRKALKNIKLNMKGYKGFVARNMDGTLITAFVYNTNVIDSLSSGLIQVGRPGYWGSPQYPRYPFYFKFAYHTKTTTDTIYAVVIHAEAGGGAGAYQSRRKAAESLHKYLVNNKPKANIIFLGDYNDDVDVSIYHGIDSSYEIFVKDNNSFKTVTMEISNNGQTTYIGYSAAIDHITVSNELVDEYMSGSAKAITKVNEWLGISVDKYDRTTTGHYPVLAKFEF